MQEQRTWLAGALATRVFLSFACGYLLSYAFRSVNAVIAPALMEEAGLSNADLGLLSAAYFVTFACLQLPLGIWLDRYGPRRVEVALLFFAAAGSAVFAMSSGLLGLWIGRALIGVGVSACLMAPLKAFREWFEPQRQSQLASWMLFAGTVGALSATVPVVTAMPVIGWRGVFWVMSGLIVLVALAIHFLVAPAERLAAQRPAQTTPANSNAATTGAIAGVTGGYKTIFGDPYFQRLTMVGGVLQGSFVALQSLWAGPWLMNVQGMDKTEASQVLFIFNLVLMASYLFLSWWAPRRVAQSTHHGWPVVKVVAWGMAGAIVTQFGLVLWSGPASWILWLILALFLPIVSLAQSQVSLSFPAALAGRANSAYNLMIFVFAFGVQWGLGVLIDAFKGFGASQVDAMRMALTMLVVMEALTVLAFAMHRAQQPRASVSSV